MTPKHTPGPWAVQEYDHVNCLRFIGVASDPSGPSIAQVPESDGLRDEAEQAANARLIAAAPETAAERDRLRAINAELTSALEWAERALSPFSKEPAEKSGMNMIRAALARAKGK